MRPSPFVLPFFGSLALLILTSCRTPPPPRADGELHLVPPDVEEVPNPSDARALAWIGIALHRELRQDSEGAVAAYQSALDSNPEDPSLYLYITKRLIQAGRQEDAFALLARVLERDPENIQALRWTVRLHVQSGDAEGALHTIEATLPLRPEDETFYLEALQSAVEAERTDMALSIARQGRRNVASGKRITDLYLRLLDAARQGADDLQTISDLQDEYLRELESALNRFPKEPSFLFMKAEQAFKSNTPKAAFTSYTSIDALAENKDDQRARILVHAIQQLGGGRKGSREFRKLTADLTGNALVYYLRGLLWELQGASGQALNAYTKASDLAPEDTASLRKRAVLAYQEGKREKSLSLLSRVLELEPDDPDMHLLSGQIALASERYDKAADHLTQRLELQKQGFPLENPASANALLAIALWETDHEMADILNALEAAGQDTGYLEQVWRHRYRTLLRIREEDASMAEQLEVELLRVLEDLSDRLPRNPEPAWLTATTYSMRKNYELALEFLEEVEFRSRFTETPDAWLGDDYWFDVAAAQERNGNLEEAEKIFLRILEKNPNHHSSLNYVAYMWAEQGVHLDKASTYVLRAMQLDPDNGSYTDTLGWVYFQQGEFEKAYQQLLRSSELIPDESVVAEHLGDVLMKLQRPVEARGYYRIALALGPGERREIVQASLEACEIAISDLMHASVEPPAEEALLTH